MKGGYRKGAGRKKGFAALEAEKAREFIAKKVSAQLDTIVDSLIREAKKGDKQSIQILFDRAWGRPLQAVNIKETLTDFEPITSIQIISPRAERNSLKTMKTD